MAACAILLKRTEKMFKFGPFNWVRFKLVPSTTAPNDGKKHYNVLMAFDTRTKYKSDGYNEYPVFPAQYEKLMNFELCSNEFSSWTLVLLPVIESI